MVTEAVAALEDRTLAPTVNAVADEIGIDQSGASRLIKSAVDAGYLTMTTTTSDGRRREASVAAAGRLALRDAHRWQEDVFAELTADWSQKRRDEFRHAMSDLMDRSSAIGLPGAAAPLSQPPGRPGR